MSTTMIVALILALGSSKGGFRVAFDMDDTICDMGYAFGPVASRVLGREVVQVGALQYDICTMYGITWDDACIVFDSMEWANELYFLRAREDMLQLMRALIAVGVEVVCITARGACDVYPSHMSTVRDATDMWLRANDMHVRVVHALDKAAYMVAEGGYIAIFDDAAHTRAACAAVGIAAFMP